MSRSRRRVVPATALAAAVLAGPLAAQRCEAPAGAIRIVGEVETPVTLSAADLAAMDSRLTVSALDPDGEPATWEGVTLRAILDRAGVPGGETLHGRGLSAYVVVEARDGYMATFALAELDAGYWDRLPFLADRRDAEPLDDHAGPFQVIVPDAPKHGRWARQVACLRVAYPD